jgi:hypothetical protein
MAVSKRDNFILELAALPDGKFRLTARTPIGTTTVDVDNPFTQAEIDDLGAVLGRRRRVPAPTEQQMASQFGARMFRLLFESSRDVYAAYLTSLDRAGARGLRFRLSVERAGIMADIPWELIRDPQRDHLALSSSTPLVRTVSQLTVRPPVRVASPLRVLVMISSPSEVDGIKIAKLDVEGEWTRLQEATEPLRKNGLLELVRLERATPIALQRKLRQEVFHIFHYIGHSDYDDLAGRGVLILESEGDPERGVKRPAERLGQELGNENTIRLVVMNSCHSGRLAERDSLAGIAGNLVTRGIGAVVAMQYAITDGSAKAFSEEFYRAIAEFLPIDTAVSEARRAVSNRRDNAEWATPVLYMQAEDEGVIFEAAPAAAPPPRPPEPVREIDLPIQPPEPTPQQTPPRLPVPLLTAGAVALLVFAILIILTVVNPPQPPPTPTLTDAPTLEPTLTPAPLLLPDLRIGAMRVSPNRPAPGQTFRISVAITNAGGADSGPFAWSWDASLRPPVLLNTQSGTVENIPPGATRTISFPFTYGWWGAYSGQIKVDVDSQVQESDERDNNQPFEIALTNDQPFDLDFTFLPNNEIVQPPLVLPDDSFGSWNLDIALNAAGRPLCANVPLKIVDVGDGIVGVTVEDVAAPPECVMLPISIVVTRRVVANAVVEVMGESDGAASMTLYADSAGERPIGQAFGAALIAGEFATLGIDDGVNRGIRRIDVRANGQPILITRLTLFPPPDAAS